MKVQLAKKLKQKPKAAELVFGKNFTDHMYVMKYADGKWDEGAIVPYAPFAMPPATTVLHYGQGIFEGLKAYKTEDGKVTLFRPRDNFIRMNRSCEILCMPQLDADKVLNGLYELLKVEKDWIPTDAGTSLYVRPFMVGTDEALGVHASRNYTFAMICCPVGAYYKNGLQPTRIYVEDIYVRAPLGGTGEAKCLGNYGASLRAGEIAQTRGYDQVLWLDAAERKYVEEVGSMNIFFVIGNEVVTPQLVGSILHGITRDSLLKIASKYGYQISERRVSIEEVIASADSGELKECFGSGTAAVVSPVGELTYKGEKYSINGGRMGKITEFLYDRLTGIQTERYPDEFGWIVDVK